LGAFWGAGKPIIAYLAEASITDDELPQIVQGDGHGYFISNWDHLKDGIKMVGS
jgi:hypothetical protein